MLYKHFIITRFNLSQRWDKDSLGNGVLDEEWLKKRFQLFEDYCFPSVRSQTNKNFEWLVYFDIATNNYYKSKIEKLSNEFPNFKPIFKKSYQEFEETLSSDLLKYTKGRKIEFVITTRLDNDDIIAKDTVELLQKKIVDYKCILQMPIGYNLELNSISRLRKMNYPLNPFISLLESVKNNQLPETVYACQHGAWGHLRQVSISNKPQWVQVIHGNNVSNQIKGKEIIAFGALNGFTFNKPKFAIGNDIALVKKYIKKKIKSVLGK